MAHLGFSFDLRSSPTGSSHTELVSAVLEICEWADGVEGLASSAMLLEHHCSSDGYLPTPILLAAAIAGRTKRMRLAIMVLAPLFHPLRLAEELAMLDLISEGRTSFMLGAGYRAEEFAAFGVRLEDRGVLMEQALVTLDRAWTGEPFEFQGSMTQILPRPMQRPRPPIILGGGSKAAARRAARLADGFAPMDPGLMEVYREELVKLGKPAPEAPPNPGGGGIVVAVSEQPDATWSLVAPHCLHEMNTYAQWLRDGMPGGAASAMYFEVADTDELRATGRYEVLTPGECIERAKAQGGSLSLSPLTGGISPEVARETIGLIESSVLPAL